MAALPPLTRACERGRLRTVRRLLAAGVNPDERHTGEYGDEWIALHRAALHGRADIVDELLAAGADIESADEDRKTAVFCAAMSDDLATVKMLVAAGADVLVTDSAGEGPADQTQSATVMDFLLDRGSAVGFGTAIHAAEMGSRDCLRILAAHGVDLGAVDSDGTSLDSFAILHGHADLADDIDDVVAGRKAM